MKPGDLVVLNSDNAYFPEGLYGWHEMSDANVWIPNGTIGVCIEGPTRLGYYRFSALINGTTLWFRSDQAKVLDETG
jgi:hypothetical protein